MTTRTSPWPAGVPCWADLATPDVGAAKAFYAAVLGWDYQDTGDEYRGYVLAQRDGHATAGIGPLPEGAPNAWTLYMASDDADATAAAVTANGGVVVVPPADVGDVGRMAIAADPTGAAFGVWQPGQHIGAGLVNEPGGITWEDLRSPDPDTARAFYSAVFGYDTQALDGAPGDYTTFTLAGGEAPLGGIGGMMGADGMPAHWLIYFSVASTDDAVAAAEAGGGTVIAPAFDTPFGRMAGVADPLGATFWLAQYTEQASQHWAE
jgi:predicted enzyme related to lactoylglutathione lyase